VNHHVTVKEQALGKYETEDDLYESYELV